jgi:membrane protease YdiL (CAAX protease family)
MNNGIPVLPDGRESGTPPNVWGPWPTLGFALAIGAVYLIVALVVLLPFLVEALPHSADPGQLLQSIMDKAGLITAISTILTAAICIWLIVILIRVRKASVKEYLGLRRISWKTVMVLIAATAGLLLATAGVSQLFKNPTDDLRLFETSVYPPVLWLALVVFAPVLEEAVFRGFLFEGFRRSRMGTVLTVIIMAMAWASLHIQYNFAYIAIIFFVGIALGFARVRSGSLWSPILMHSLFNLAAVIQAIMSPSQGGIR